MSIHILSLSAMKGLMSRFASGRQGQPSGLVLDCRTLQSSCESGPCNGYDVHKRKRGSKVHMAVDTLGHHLAVHVTPVNLQRERLTIPPITRRGVL